MTGCHIRGYARYHHQLYKTNDDRNDVQFRQLLPQADHVRAVEQLELTKKSYGDSSMGYGCRLDRRFWQRCRRRKNRVSHELWQLVDKKNSRCLICRFRCPFPLCFFMSKGRDDAVTDAVKAVANIMDFLTHSLGESGCKRTIHA